MEPDETEALFLTMLAGEGYTDIRKLPTGEWAAVKRFLFTFGLCVGLDRSGYRTRFCYGTEIEAAAALHKWDGEGFPPGWWIKMKPEDISNPMRQESTP